MQQVIVLEFDDNSHTRDRLLKLSREPEIERDHDKDRSALAFEPLACPGWHKFL